MRDTVGARQGTCLQGRQLPVALGRQVQQGVELGPVEGLVLCGALHLDEAAVAGLDHVHVRVGAHVLLVGQVQAGEAVDDAHADGADRVGQDRPARLWGDQATLSAPGDGVRQGDIGAGHGGGAGAAVGLKHVAVQGDGVLAQGGDVHHPAQGAADQAGDLVRAAPHAALDGLPPGALRASAGEHGVLGGHPALAAALAPAGDALREGGYAQHTGAAELDQHRALAVLGPAAGDGDGAELVGGTPVLAGEVSGSHVSEGYRWGRGGPNAVTVATAGAVADRRDLPQRPGTIAKYQGVPRIGWVGRDKAVVRC